MTSSPDGRGAADRIVSAADTTHLASLRAHVRRIAERDGAPREVAEDFELVVTELATNVIRHTDDDEITVDFALVDDAWVLDLWPAPSGIDLSAIESPVGLDSSGRGLPIVRALTDLVEIVDLDGVAHLRCTKHAV